MTGRYGGGTGTGGEHEDEAFKDSKLLGVIGEVVALHPEKLLLFKLDLVALGVHRFPGKYLSLNYFKLLELFWMFFTTFVVVSTLRTSDDGDGYYNSSACCALVFGLRLNQTTFSLGSSCF